MDINATLIGQMITFAIFVWFTMKFVWPILEKILRERQQKISEGLAAAERGHQEVEIAQKYAIQYIHETRAKAAEILENAKRQAAILIEEAKAQAIAERDQMLALGKAEIEQERRRVKEELQQEVVGLAIASAEKLLDQVMTESLQTALLNVGSQVVFSEEAQNDKQQPMTEKVQTTFSGQDPNNPDPVDTVKNDQNQSAAPFALKFSSSSKKLSDPDEGRGKMGGNR